MSFSKQGPTVFLFFPIPPFVERGRPPVGERPRAWSPFMGTLLRKGTVPPPCPGDGLTVFFFSSAWGGTKWFQKRGPVHSLFDVEKERFSQSQSRNFFVTSYSSFSNFSGCWGPCRVPPLWGP